MALRNNELLALLIQIAEDCRADGVGIGDTDPEAVQHVTDFLRELLRFRTASDGMMNEALDLAISLVMDGTAEDPQRRAHQVAALEKAQRLFWLVHE